MDVQLEQRLVELASELFLKHGIKSVTMDTIAMEAGISKRTLYALFQDKDTLLLRTLEYQKRWNAEEREEIIRKCRNAFELILQEFLRVSQRMRHINCNYLRDLKKYHPQVAVYLERDRETTKQQLVEVIEEGMREGFIRSELNSRILALLLQVQLEIIISSDEIEKNHFSFWEVFETIGFNYVRGIATEKGRLFLEEYMEGNK